MKKNRIRLQKLCEFGALTALAACGPLGESSISVQKNMDPSVQLKDKDAIAQYLTPIPPESAALSLAAEPFLAPASEGGTLRVPTISLTGLEEKRADYAQIARCSSKVILKTASGEKLEDIPADSAGRLQKLKWVWVNSIWTNSIDCKIVGGTNSYNARPRFQDLSAKSGNFFYVINPCLQPERSTKKETCSYNLIVTKELAYENTLTADFMQTAEELSLAEASLAGLYSQLYYDAQLLRMRKDECENNYAVSQSSQNFWKGLLSFTLGGVGASIGAVMSGGTAALQGFKTGLSIAVGFFKKFPTEPNICPTADKVIQNAQDSSTSITPVIQRVLELRMKLSEIDKKYGEIDKSILQNKENDSAQ